MALFACATAPTGPTPVQREQRVAEAQRQIEQGRPLAAVRIYRELAESEDPAERQRWRLRITELLFDEGYPELALEYHRQLDAELMPPELITRKRVVDGLAAVARGQGVLALRLLPEPTTEMSDRLRARLLEGRADALAMTGRPARALEARIERDSVLLDADPLRQNDEAIWELLQSIRMERLQQVRERTDDTLLRGWADLALSVRRARLGGRPVSAALADWQRRFPRHPALERFLPILRERIVAELTYPEIVALLLPLSGRYAAPAGAIRDGLLTAYYNQPAEITRPQLMIIDTGEDGQSALSAYQRAVESGAGLVIGPLDKAAVDDLAGRESLPVPVLTLNYLPDGRPSPSQRMVQFGLLPEDEARQAAEVAIQNGHFNGVVLTPSGARGERMLKAFRGRYRELGGVVLEAARYDPDATDHARQIRAMLGLDHSYARRRQLQRLLGEQLRFEPRRRQDVEVVFLSASPEQARLIEPQLEFHRAAELPVYATSRVFTGTPDPKADWDMNGLYFTDIPWVLDNLEQGDALHAAVRRSWPDRHERFPRLFALGIDALAVIPHLERMRSDATAAFAGRSGRLRLAEGGRIERRLQWAVFEKGRPRPIDRPGTETEAGEGETTGEDVRERASDP